MAENADANAQNTNTANAASTENKEASSPTLLATETKQGEGTKATEAGNTNTATATSTEKTQEQKPVVPEKYELKLPEGSQLNPARIERIEAFAKEKGLSNEQAQILVDRESDAAADAVSSYEGNLKAAQQQKAAQWEQQARNDSEIGGQNFNESVEMAKRVVERFGSDTLKSELNQTGFGNHPELIRVLARIGKSMSEDKLLVANANGKKTTVLERFYGKTE